jgi:hypothetical protein
MIRQIKKIIADSSLVQEEKDEFIKNLLQANEEQLATLKNLLEEDPKLTEILYKNYKDKLEAFSKGDSEAWKKILEDEKFLLSFSSEKN